MATRAAKSKLRHGVDPRRLDRDDVRHAIRQLLEIEPELTISGFFARIPVPLESMTKTYAEALAAAGLPA